ncbi:MAG: heme exporter protein CcmB [Candidatus Eisenbacteria bacterium]
MGEVLRHALAIAGKDLRLEFRSRTAFLSALVFTALVLAIFQFARDPTAVSAVDLAPGILWITFSFAGLLGLNRAFALERENRALDGLLLSPASRTALYLGKVLANLVFVGLVEAIALPLFAIFFNVPVLGVLGPLVAVIALATIGFVAVGTLMSSIAVSTRFAELMLPVLMLPFLMPPITAAVQMTARIFAGRPFSEIIGWLKLLVAYDVAFLVVCILVFEHTIEE